MKMALVTVEGRDTGSQPILQMLLLTSLILSFLTIFLVK
jgi:hypothetical protein